MNTENVVYYLESSRNDSFCWRTVSIYASYADALDAANQLKADLDRDFLSWCMELQETPTKENYAAFGPNKTLRITKLTTEVLFKLDHVPFWE